MREGTTSQTGGNPCFWYRDITSATGASVMSGAVPVSYYVGSTCGGGIVGNATFTNTYLYLSLSGTTFTARIYMLDAAHILGAVGCPMYFRGSASVSSPVLCRGGTINFTNNLAGGEVDSIPSDQGGVDMFGAGTGGSLAVSFRSSCCQ